MAKTNRNSDPGNGEINTEDISMEEMNESKETEHFNKRKLKEIEISIPKEPGTEEKHSMEQKTTETLTTNRRIDTLFLHRILMLRSAVINSYRRHQLGVRRFLKYAMAALYLAYFVYALQFRFGDEGSLTLLILTLLVLTGLVYHHIKITFGEKIYELCGKPVVHFFKRHEIFFTRFFIAFVVVAVAVYIVVDVAIQRPAHLVSGAGIIVYIFVMFIFSHNPWKVRWRPVLWGILLQFIFALLVLRTTWGQASFSWLSRQVIIYLTYTDAGASFVFGKSFMDHFFVFRVLPTIVFFSATISILYYLGWMQAVIEKIGFLLQYSLDAGAVESLHAAINIFIGWGEGIMMVRPLLDKMSLPEIHTVMTNGFATVAGSTLGIYVLYGVPANHLISASIMSAPAALALSKLFWPDDDDDDDDLAKKKRKAVPDIPKMGHSIVDAASSGAVSAIAVCSHIVVNLITYFSILAFVNATLKWLGLRVGIENLTFQLMCSYIFWPLVYLMGVRMEDCTIVGRMVGIKVFVNEFIAYSDLGKVRHNRIEFEQYNGTWNYTRNDDIFLVDKNLTLVGGIIEPRSEMIATYALCGFSDLVAFSIMIAALSAVAPSRKYDFLRAGPRALISGICACFLTACMAGLLGGNDDAGK